MNPPVSSISVLPPEGLSSTARVSESSFSSLLEELIQKIFSYLPYENDANIRRVCRSWSRIADTFEDDALKIYGAKAWEEVFGIQINSSIPESPKEIRKTSRALLGRLAIPTGASLLLIPKDLTLNLLMGQIRRLFVDSLQFSLGALCDRQAYLKYGEEKVQQSYWVLMTHEIAPPILRRSYSETVSQLQNNLGKACTPPTLVEVLALCFLHADDTSERLLPSESCAYTFCTESLGSVPLIAGMFSETAFDIDLYSLIQTAESASNGLEASKGTICEFTPLWGALAAVRF